MTEKQLQQVNSCIEKIAQGYVSALDELSCLVSGRMLSVALSVVKNRALAEDVVQDSFVKIVNNAARFRRGTNGYAWICKIVHNVALNTLRHEKRFAAENVDDYWTLSDGSDVAEQSTAAGTVKQAMAMLTEEEKQVVYQKYFMDFTVRDSAKLLGKSKSTVQRLLTAAEEKLKKYLRDGTK